MKTKQIIKLAVGILFPLGIAAVFIWAKYVKLPLPCVFREITGLYCPSCGITRAIMSIFNLDIPAALGYNVFITISFVPLVTAAACCCMLFITDRLDRVFAKYYRQITITAAAWTGAFFVFGILRNIPFFPFTLLAPGI